MGDYFSYNPGAESDRFFDAPVFFKHKPLDLAGQWIRVLQVRPGSLRSPVECSIRHIKLGSEAYICLSYTWGDEDHAATILVNDQPFQVTENVWRFLLAIRNKNIRFPLWIDLMCIDQQNVQERNHQVQQMATIYRTASRVIVWLGQASTGQTKLLLWLGGSDGELTSIDDLKVVGSGDQHCINGLGRAEILEQHHWEAFRQLCWKSYWTRLWIVQEIVLAKAVTIMCGAVCISWPLLVSFCNLVIRADDNSELLGGRRKATRALVQNITNLARLSHGGHDASLHLGQAAVAFNGQICRDFHDHVYGVLGLVESGSGFHVDYSESALTLCTRVLEHDATTRELSSTYIDRVISSCNTLRRALVAKAPPSAIPITVARTYMTQEPVGILLPAQFEMPPTSSLPRRKPGLNMDLSTFANVISFEVWLICKTALPTPSYPTTQPLLSEDGGVNKGLRKLDEPPGYVKHSPHYYSVPCVHELQGLGIDYAIFSLFSRTETACTYRWTGGPGAWVRDQSWHSSAWLSRGRRADEEDRLPVPRNHNTNMASTGQDQPAPYVMLLPKFEPKPTLSSNTDFGAFRNLNFGTQYMRTGILPFRDGDPCFHPRCNKRLILLHDRDVSEAREGASVAATTAAATKTQASVPSKAEAPLLRRRSSVDLFVGRHVPSAATQSKDRA